MGSCSGCTGAVDVAEPAVSTTGGQRAEEDPCLAQAIAALEYKNGLDEKMTYASHRRLDAARLKIVATAFPEVASKAGCYAVVAKKEGQVKEFVVTVGDIGAAPEFLTGACQISFEDLTPSECIEYSFKESDTWAMAQLSLGALESYRGMKFEQWKEMLETPVCEAQFRRLLQIGLIDVMFDAEVFPTPENLKSKYQFTDPRSGKLVQLPHPVAGLRVWDPEAQEYKRIEARLIGAPSAAEASNWWTNFVKELSEKHGAEYVAGLMQGK